MCKVFPILLRVLVKIKLEQSSPCPKVEKHYNMLRIFYGTKRHCFLITVLNYNIVE